jgi:hypothetical protein
MSYWAAFLPPLDSFQKLRDSLILVAATGEIILSGCFSQEELMVTMLNPMEELQSTSHPKAGIERLFGTYLKAPSADGLVTTSILGP